MYLNKKKTAYFISVLFLSALTALFSAYLLSKKNTFANDLKLLFNCSGLLIAHDNIVVASNAANRRYIPLNINGYVSNLNVYFSKIADKEIPIIIYEINGNRADFVGSAVMPAGKYYVNLTVNRFFSNLAIYIKNQNCYEDIGKITVNESVFNKYFLMKFFILFIFVCFIFAHLIFNIRTMYEKIFKYKYIIAFAFVAFAVIFELNGSSLAMWQFSVDSIKKETVLIGKPRWIRTDEWCVYTPILLSQTFSGYKYFNGILRGTKTDMFLFYAQPVKNAMSVFRPFLCGFFVFDAPKGLAFFWAARIAALFVVSFAFFMMITGNKKMLSLTGTLLVTFAPAVQWWFTPNGIAEMLIFGQLAVLMIYRYVSDNVISKRLIYLAVIFICCGAYALTVYPPWQIPFAYVFISAALWVIFENKHKCKIGFYDAAAVSFFALFLIVCFFYIYNKSADTIYSLMHTVYPGKRFENGGGQLFGLFQSWGNIFFSFKDFIKNSNMCEKAAFIDFFPLGIILSCWVIFKEKIKDMFLIIMTVCSVFLGFWCVAGVPNFIADITFMKMSPAHRTLVVFGFINILVLIRALSLIKTKIKYNVFMSVLFTAAAVYASVYVYGQYLNTVMIFIITVLSFIIFLAGLNIKHFKFFASAAVLTVLAGGLFVNPVQSGTAGVNETPLAAAIRKIDLSKRGLWMTEGTNFNIPNYIIMQGAAAVNSTNTYPNTQLWRKFDKDGKYENIYNRYCHVLTSISCENPKDKFQLMDFDVIQINLQPGDLAVLDVDYILTKNDLSKFNAKDIRFKEIYSDVYYKIFEVERVLNKNEK